MEEKQAETSKARRIIRKKSNLSATSASPPSSAASTPRVARRRIIKKVSTDPSSRLSTSPTPLPGKDSTVSKPVVRTKLIKKPEPTRGTVPRTTAKKVPAKNPTLIKKSLAPTKQADSLTTPTNDDQHLEESDQTSVVSTALQKDVPQSVVITDETSPPLLVSEERNVAPLPSSALRDVTKPESKQPAGLCDIEGGVGNGAAPDVAAESSLPSQAASEEGSVTALREVVKSEDNQPTRLSDTQGVAGNESNSEPSPDAAAESSPPSQELEDCNLQPEVVPDSNVAAPPPSPPSREVAEPENKHPTTSDSVSSDINDGESTTLLKDAEGDAGNGLSPPASEYGNTQPATTEPPTESTNTTPLKDTLLPEGDVRILAVQVEDPETTPVSNIAPPPPPPPASKSENTYPVPPTDNDEGTTILKHVEGLIADVENGSNSNVTAESTPPSQVASECISQPTPPDTMLPTKDVVLNSNVAASSSPSSREVTTPLDSISLPIPIIKHTDVLHTQPVTISVSEVPRGISTNNSDSEGTAVSNEAEEPNAPNSTAVIDESPSNEEPADIPTTTSRLITLPIPSTEVTIASTQKSSNDRSNNFNTSEVPQMMRDGDDDSFGLSSHPMSPTDPKDPSITTPINNTFNQLRSSFNATNAAEDLKQPRGLPNDSSGPDDCLPSPSNLKAANKIRDTNTKVRKISFEDSSEQLPKKDEINGRNTSLGNGSDPQTHNNGKAKHDDSDEGSPLLQRRSSCETDNPLQKMNKKRLSAAANRKKREQEVSALIAGRRRESITNNNTLERRAKSLGDMSKTAKSTTTRRGSQHLLVPPITIGKISKEEEKVHTVQGLKKNDSVFMDDAVHTPRLLQESLKNNVTLNDIPEFIIDSEGSSDENEQSTKSGSKSSIFANVVGMLTPRSGSESTSTQSPNSRQRPSLTSAKSMAPSFFSTFARRGGAALSASKSLGHSAEEMECIRFALEVSEPTSLRISLTSELFEYAVGCGLLRRLSSPTCTDIKLYSSKFTDPTQFSSLSSAISSRVTEVDEIHFSSFTVNGSFEFTNSVISIDCVQPLVELINVLEEPLSSINLTNLQLQTADGPVPFTHWGLIFSGLNVSCESLVLAGNEVSSEALQYLSLYIARFPFLKSVDLTDCSDILSQPDGLKWLHDCVAYRIIENEPPLDIYLRDTNVPYTHGWTALDYAVIRNDVVKTSELIGAKDVKLESRDGLGRTVLHLAAGSGSEACLKILIEFLQDTTNVDVPPLLDYEDVNGLTALEFAASRCYEKCAKVLIDAGAKVGAPVLESALSLVVEHQDCVENNCSETLQDHRGCAKSKRLSKEQLTLISSHAHGPLRRVALRAFFPGFIMYGCFLFLITYSASTISTNFDSTDYISTKTLKGKMEGTEETIFAKQDNAILINEVNRVAEIFDWADSVMLPVLKEANQDESCDVVGAVRLRQVRVVPIPSFCDDDVSANKECWIYRGFTSETEDKSSFTRSNQTWSWESTNEPVTLDSELGHNYGSDGFFELLGSADITQARNQLNHLRDVHWIDEATRAFFIDLTFYKKNTARFIACHTVFELPPSGGIVVSMELVSIATWRKDSVFLIFLLGMSGLILIADEVRDLLEERRQWANQQLIRKEQKSLSTVDPEVANITKRVLKLLGRAKGHLFESWNAVDIIMIVLLLAVVVDCCYLPELDAVSFTNDTVYTSFSDASSRTTRLRDTFGLLVTTGWAKSLKYMVHLPVAGPTVNAVVATLANIKILTFMMLFVVVSLSLSLGLHFTLGNTIQEFSTFKEAGLAFFRMVFGDFDVTSFTAHTSIVGEVLFVTCLVTANFMLMTILIAVIDIEYEEQLNISSTLWQQHMVDSYICSMRAVKRPVGVSPSTVDASIEPPKIHYIITEPASERLDVERSSPHTFSLLSPNKPRKCVQSPLCGISMSTRDFQSASSLKRVSSFTRGPKQVDSPSKTSKQDGDLHQFSAKISSEIKDLADTLQVLLSEVDSLKNQQKRAQEIRVPSEAENRFSEEWDQVQLNLGRGVPLDTWSAYSTIPCME